MRVFLGIGPDAATRETIGAARSKLEAELGEAASGFKWTRSENLHVTLHFLGEVPASRIDLLRQVLAAPVPEPPFAASIGRFGAFPERGAVRVIWLGLSRGSEPMARVHAVCADRLRQLRIDVEDRPFTPHFTLARARDRQGSGAVRRLLDSAAAPPPASWEVTGATLFRSDLSGAAPKYEPLAEVSLAGGAGPT